MANNYNIDDSLKSFELETIQKVQEFRSLPFSVCCLNLKSDLNISTMIRTASILGAENFIIFGRRRFDRRGCVGAQNYINLIRVNGLTEEGEINVSLFLDFVKSENYTPVYCEVGGEDYRNFNFRRVSNPLLVFGEENENGVPSSLLNSGGPVVGIPQVGVMRSLNVSCASAIIIEQISRQLR